MTHPQPELTAQDIQRIATAFRESRILLSGFEMGVFTAIGDGARSAADIAQAVGAEASACVRLLDALCAMGFLRKDAGLYENAPVAARHLVRGRPGYLAGLAHTNHIFDNWARLSSVVRDGQAGNRLHVQAWDEARVEAFIGAMHARGVTQARALAPLIDMNGVSRVLDVGGGSGAFAMEIIRNHPNARATVFDLPSVIPLTRRYVEEAGLSDRVDFAVGDYATDELPPGCDLAFLSAVIHSNSAELNTELFRKCRCALNPGGRIVVLDWIMDDGRTAPPPGALFAINMLVATPFGNCWTEKEIASWLAAAGFSQPTRVKTDIGTDMLFAERT